MLRVGVRLHSPNTKRLLALFRAVLIPAVLMWGVFRTASDHENLRHRVVTLREFPVDARKIHRSLIREMHADGSTSDIVGLISELAHKMGMRVIAEGIESPRQVERLLELGCEFGQGYYFSQDGPESGPAIPASAGSLARASGAGAS